MKSLLTVKQVAEMLLAKPSTIYAWAEQDKIPCLKLNGSLRFLEQDIMDWIETCRKEVVCYNSDTGRRPGRGGQN